MKALIFLPMLFPFLLIAQGTKIESQPQQKSSFYNSQNHKWGINTLNFTHVANGKPLLSIPYHKVKPIHQSLYLLSRNGKEGIIDLIGEQVLVPTEYDQIYFDYFEPRTDYFVVEKDNQYGLIDRKGQIVLPVEYDEMYMDVRNLFLVSRNGNQWQLRDLSGQLLTNDTFEEIEKTFYFPIPVKEGGKWGYVDRQGQSVLPFQFDNAEGFFMVEKTSPGGKVPRKYIREEPFENQAILAKVEVNGEKKWIDQSGKFVRLPQSYIEHRGIRTPANLLEHTDKIIKDKKGNYRFPPYKIYVTGPDQDSFLIRYKNNYYGDGLYISSPSKVAILPEKDATQNYFNGTWHYSTEAAEAISDSQLVYYDKIQRYSAEPSPARWVVKDNFYGLIDRKGQLRTPLHFDRLGHQQEGLIAAEKDGKAGFINAQGETVIPFEFDVDQSYHQPYEFKGGISICYLNGKYGFINKKGELITDCSYDAVAYFEEGLAIVYQNEKWERVVLEH